MTKSVNSFANELTEWLIGLVFIKSQFHMSMYYKYEPYGTKVVVLSYVDDCAYWYASESLGKWLVETLGKISHVNFLGFAHWFMSIRISHMKDHSISVDQARYYTYILSKYIYTSIFKTSTKFTRPLLP